MCVFVLCTSCLRAKTHYYYMWPFAKKLCHGWINTMTSSNEISWKLSPPKWRAGCAPSCSRSWFISFLFSDSCFSATQIAKTSLLALTVAALCNRIVLHAHCNCRPLSSLWSDASPGKSIATAPIETAKHFHNCSKVLSQFRTPCCTNLRQYSDRPKRGGAHYNAQIA